MNSNCFLVGSACEGGIPTFYFFLPSIKTSKPYICNKVSINNLNKTKWKRKRKIFGVL